MTEIDLDHEERLLIVRGLLRLRDDGGRVSTLMEKVVPGAADELRDHIVPRPGKTLVYFIAAGPFERNGTPVKIGVSKSPGERLEALQTSHHKKLSLVLAVPGTRTLENTLHAKFRDQRLRIDGEWFRSCPEMRRLVASLGEQVAA